MFLGFALLALQLGRVRDLSIADGRRLDRRAAAAARPDRRRSSSARTSSPRWPSGWPRPRACSSSGRVRGFPVAREGAQKFKEISYRHAEAYQTSELKHGPLALIDSDGADGRDRARRRADRPQRRRAARDRRPRRAAGRGHPRGRRPRRGRRRPRSTYRATSASSTRSCSPSPCSCWPTTRPGSSATTSTSRATWPSRSPWSDGRRRDVESPWRGARSPTVDGMSDEPATPETTFADLGLDDGGAQGAARRRLRDAVADPGRDHPAAARGPRRRGPRADRHRQDRGVRAADPVPARPEAEDAAGAGARADP